MINDVTKAVLKELNESRIKVTPELVEAVVEQPLYDPAFTEEEFTSWKEAYKAWKEATKEPVTLSPQEELAARLRKNIIVDPEQEEQEFWDFMEETRADLWNDPEYANEIMEDAWVQRASEMDYAWTQEHRKLTPEEAQERADKEIADYKARQKAWEDAGSVGEQPW